VLEATDDLIREERDAVTQASVALRTELDPGTTSQVMKALAKAGLVDRGPDMTGPAYRIIVTQEGRRRLRQAVERVENVAG
jgi:DNA-binding MarR family transcriptional regulator